MKKPKDKKISVSVEVWKRLVQLKYQLELKSIDEAIRKLFSEVKGHD